MKSLFIMFVYSLNFLGLRTIKNYTTDIGVST